MTSCKSDPCKEKLKKELEVVALNAKIEGHSDSQIEAMQELMLVNCREELAAEAEKEKSTLWNYYHTEVINSSLTTEEQRKADREIRKLIDKYFTRYKNAILLHAVAFTNNYTDKWAFQVNNVLGIEYAFDENSPNGELIETTESEYWFYRYPSLDDCFKAIVPWVENNLSDEGDNEMGFYYEGLVAKFGKKYYEDFILPYFNKE
jgi:hypothetical protein